MTNEPFLTNVRIRNYKSIGGCDVDLGHLNLLVGRNGSGKSNFLDALRFVLDSLQNSLDHAIRTRGGIDEVRRRSTGHPHNFGIQITMTLPDDQTAIYGFEIASQKKGWFVVKHERLKLLQPNGEIAGAFTVEGGEVKQATLENMPPASPDRLYLVNAAGLPVFRPIYDALSAMGFYCLNPEQIKEVQAPDSAELLRRDGGNLASVVARLTEDRPDLKRRVQEYLAAIVEDLVDFERVPLGPRETVRFRQRVKGSEHPWGFYAASMSDGTLRTLGILVAVLQLAHRSVPVRLVGIEEPETALHPAAAGALMDALREAATNTQVLLTTHSPDLLDRCDLSHDRLFAVHSNQGTTEIGPADPACIESIKTHLYSAGELLRMGQLQPDRVALARQRELDFSFAEQDGKA